MNSTSYQESVRAVGVRLGLAEPDPTLPDWEHRCADAKQVHAWLHLFTSQQANLSDAEQLVFMGLLLSSYDDALSDGIARPEDWEQLRKLLCDRLDLFGPQIEYWAMVDEYDLSADPDDDHRLALTPQMRNLLRGQ